MASCLSLVMSASTFHHVLFLAKGDEGGGAQRCFTDPRGHGEPHRQHPPQRRAVNGQYVLEDDESSQTACETGNLCPTSGR